LTLKSVAESEEAANYDFLHGEGAWARKQKAIEEAEKRWAERRAEQAKAEAEAERVYAEWAAANPEEAAKEAEKERKKARQKAQRRALGGGGFRYRQESASEKRRDSSAYWSGRDAGKDVSIDPQTDHKAPSRRIAHG
jgi:hypothetical protein